jgi:acyl-CoA thioester hydrolase
MPRIYEHALTVTSDEIDRLGHVNNLAYMRWMLDAALAHSAAQGWAPERYESLGSGWVVRSHEIKYLQSAFLHDPIVVRTWVAEMKKFSSIRRYKILRRNDECLLAAAATQWAFVDYASGSLKRIPDEITGSFKPVDE